MHKVLNNKNTASKIAVSSVASSDSANARAMNTSDIFMIKIGSSSFTENGEPRHRWLKTVAEDIHYIKSLGLNVVVVCSGAVALGRKLKTGLVAKPKNESDTLKQAYAGYGQTKLMAAWEKAFAKHGSLAPQALLNKHIDKDVDMHESVRKVFAEYFSMNDVPVVNENDAITSFAIRIGNNDTMTWHLVNALNTGNSTNSNKVRFVMFLTDTNGVYTKNPQTHNDAVHYPYFSEITSDLLLSMGIDATTEQQLYSSEGIASIGTGGMGIKLLMAKKISASGAAVAITSGQELNPISRVLKNNALHTYIPAIGDTVSKTFNLALLRYES